MVYESIILLKQKQNVTVTKTANREVHTGRMIRDVDRTCDITDTRASQHEFPLQMHITHTSTFLSCARKAPLKRIMNCWGKRRGEEIRRSIREECRKERERDEESISEYKPRNECC